MKKALFAALLFIFVFVSVLPAQTASEGIEYLVQGFDAFQKNDWDSALFFLRKAVSLSDSQGPEAWYLLVMSEMFAEQYESAVKDGEYFCSFYPQSSYRPFVEYQIGRAYHYLGNYDASIKKLGSYCAKYPGHELFSSGLFWMGESLYATFYFELAKPIYERIVNEFPDSAKYTESLYRIDLINQREREEKLLYLLKVTGEEYLSAKEDYEKQLKMYQTEENYGLRKAYKESTDDLQTYKMRLEDALRERDRLLSENDTLAKQSEILQNDIDSMKALIADLTSEKESLQAKVIEAEKAQAVAEARAEAAEKNAGEKIAMADQFAQEKVAQAMSAAEKAANERVHAAELLAQQKYEEAKAAVERAAEEEKRLAAAETAKAKEEAAKEALKAKEEAQKAKEEAQKAKEDAEKLALQAKEEAAQEARKAKEDAEKLALQAKEEAAQEALKAKEDAAKEALKAKEEAAKLALQAKEDADKAYASQKEAEERALAAEQRALAAEQAALDAVGKADAAEKAANARVAQAQAASAQRAADAERAAAAKALAAEKAAQEKAAAAEKAAQEKAEAAEKAAQEKIDALTKTDEAKEQKPSAATTELKNEMKSEIERLRKKVTLIQQNLDASKIIENSNSVNAK